MSLLVVAYPDLSAPDFQRIENYRKTNDSMFSIVRPHFTLVFPVENFSVNDFSFEVKKSTGETDAFSFCLRSSVVNKDAFRELYHTFLVPDEGFSRFIKLHDKLYNGKLSGQLRIDLDYIPHIGIGNSTDPVICRKMADEWNKGDLEIKGIISSIDIIEYKHSLVTTIEKIKLNPPR